MSGDDPRPPQIVLGPFRVKREIGAGGMGVVLRAHHPESDLDVAIKTLRPGKRLLPAAVVGFDAEVRAAAALDHPYIVDIYERGVVSAEAARASKGALTEGAPWVAMELVPGGSLDGLQGRLTWRRLRPALLQILAGLAHAHARGLVHRDVKPGNVLVHPLRRCVLLTDFGLAFGAGGEAVSGAESGGTPRYMSPEQVRGRRALQGPWTDVYAVGCLAWAMVCGEPPFTGPADAVRAAHQDTPPPALQAAFKVPPGLDGWLRTALAKEPGERFGGAAEAARALAALAIDVEGPSGLLAVPQGRRRADETVLDARPAPLGDDTFFEPDAPAWGDDTFLEPDERALRGDDTVVDGFSPSGSFPSPLAAQAPGPAVEPTDFTLELAHGAPGSFAGRVPDDWRRREPTAPPNPRLLNAGLALFGVRPPPMVGRQVERDRMWRVLRDVAAARAPRLLVLRGAPGMGRTRLARWICERAEELGVGPHLWGSWSGEARRGDGLGPMLARFFGLGAGDATAVRSRLGVASDQDEGFVGAALRAAASTESGAVPRDRASTAAEVVARVAARSGVPVIGLDDVHRSEEASAFVTALLARPTPALVVVTLPLVPAGALAESVARTLLEHPGAVCVEPRRLDRAEALELIASLAGLTEILADRLEARTAGNPRFIVDLVAAWVERGLLVRGAGGYDLRDGVEVEVPEDLSTIWLDRVRRLLDGLPPGSAGVLGAAAVLGHDVADGEWRLLCRRADLPAPNAVAAACVRRGLLVPEGSGWSFPHALVREAALRLAQPSAAELHSVCADAIAAGALDRHQLELGLHLAAAGRHEEAVEELVEGAYHARFTQDRDAPLRGAAAADACLDALGVELDSRRIRVQTIRCLVDMAQGRRLQALAGFQALQEQALEVGDPDLATVLARHRANSLLDLGRADEAWEIEHDLLPPPDADGNYPGAPPGLLISVAATATRVCPPDEALVWARRAVAAVGAEPSYKRVQTLNRLAVALMTVGRNDDALEVAGEAVEMALAGGWLTSAARALNVRGETARRQGRLDEAAEAYEEAIEVCGRFDAGGDTMFRINLGFLGMARGDAPETARHGRTALEDATWRGNPTFQTYARLLLLWAESKQGDFSRWEDRWGPISAWLEDHLHREEDLAVALRNIGAAAAEHGQVERARAAWALERRYRERYGSDAQKGDVDARIDALGSASM